MTYAHAKFEVVTSKGYEKMRLQENTLFDLDLGVMVELSSLSTISMY